MSTVSLTATVAFLSKVKKCKSLPWKMPLTYHFQIKCLFSFLYPHQCKFLLVYIFHRKRYQNLPRFLCNRKVHYCLVATKTKKAFFLKIYSLNLRLLNFNDLIQRFIIEISFPNIKRKRSLPGARYKSLEGKYYLRDFATTCKWMKIE